jgi:hypothetical protein
VAILKHEEGTSQIRLLPVHGGGNRTIEAKGYSQLQSIDWAPDSKSMFVATEDPEGARLLRVGLDGKVHPIWRQLNPSGPGACLLQTDVTSRYLGRAKMRTRG